MIRNLKTAVTGQTYPDSAQLQPQQEAEEVRRLNESRERVLARLWEIADLDPEMTRNSMSAQIKALSMIVAIEDLIPSGTNGRRAGSSEKKSASPPAVSQIDIAAWLREQQGKTTAPDPAQDEDGPGVPDPPPADAADSREVNLAPPLVSASAPDSRVSPSTERTPDAWRLRL